MSEAPKIRRMPFLLDKKGQQILDNSGVHPALKDGEIVSQVSETRTPNSNDLTERKTNKIVQMQNIDTHDALTPHDDDLIEHELPFKLSNGEYLICELKRSRIVLSIVIGYYLSLFLLSFGTFLFFYSGGSRWLNEKLGFTSSSMVSVSYIFAILSLILLLVGAIKAWLFKANRMFITNEQIIRVNQKSLFSRDVQQISHLNIEDSRVEENFWGNMLGYGRIVMSTEGQGVTYILNDVVDPHEYIKIINDAKDSYQYNIGKASPVPVVVTER